MRAVIYTRVSSKKQEEGASLELQEQYCREKCAKEGFTVVEVLREVYTGAESLDERPVIYDLRQQVRHGQADFEVLMVWTLDRLSRTPRDNLTIAAELLDAGIDLWSVEQGAFKDSPEGELMLFMHGWSAKQERSMFRTRVHNALRKRVDDGKMLVGATALYGYRYADATKGSYVLDEDGTADTMRRIFRMADEGKSLRTIALTLTAEHVPTPSQLRATGKRQVSSRWSRQCVYNLLTNPSYKGEHYSYKWKHVTTRYYLDNGQRKRRTKITLRGADDSARTLIPIPPLVDPEMWDRVQVAIQRRMLSTPRQTTEQETPLLVHGFVRCGHCGAPMATAKHYGRGGYRMYVCCYIPNKTDNPDKACPGGYFAAKAETIDEAVWNAVLEVAQNQTQMERLLAARQEQARQVIADARARLAENRKRVERLTQERDTLMLRYGTETDPTFATRIRQRAIHIEDELKELEDLQGIERKREMVLETFGLFLEEARQVYSQLGGQEEEFTRAEKRKLLQACGVTVKLYNRGSDFFKETGRRYEIVFDKDLVPGRGTESMQVNML